MDSRAPILAPPSLPPLSASEAAAGPCVSVVMPTYRRAHLIGASLESLRRQRWQDFELIVQDDASPDETEAIVARVGEARIRYARNATNLGMPGNLNAGIRAARGRFVLVCHDHDLYEPDLIGEMVALLQSDPGVAYVHSAIRVIDQAGQPTGRAFIGPYARVTAGRSWARLMLSRFDSPVCANSMVPRRVYEEAGLYDPAFGFVADVEMWIRLALRGDVGYLAAPLVGVREREPGHAYFERRWEILETLMGIFRLHHAQVHPGRWWRLRLQGRIEAHLVRTLLSVVKHGGRAELRRTRAHLRRSSSLLCRAVGTLGAA